MFRPFVEMALSKSTDARELAALQVVLEAAVALDEEERTFEERMRANKALRGEGPTKLSRRKREEVDALGLDAEAIEAEQLKACAALERGYEIIAGFATALRSDISFWERGYRHVHPSDLPVVETFVARKAALHRAMREYLAIVDGEGDRRGGGR